MDRRAKRSAGRPRSALLSEEPRAAKKSPCTSPIAMLAESCGGCPTTDVSRHVNADPQPARHTSACLVHGESSVGVHRVGASVCLRRMCSECEDAAEDDRGHEDVLGQVVVLYRAPWEGGGGVAGGFFPDGTQRVETT